MNSHVLGPRFQLTSVVWGGGGSNFVNLHGEMGGGGGAGRMGKGGVGGLQF